MQSVCRAAILAVALGAAGTGAQAGCLAGAAVGGVGGHFAGHHPILGAAAGCAVGHHMAVTKKRHAAQRANATAQPRVFAAPQRR
jgi:hypothetical protein